MPGSNSKCVPPVQQILTGGCQLVCVASLPPVDFVPNFAEEHCFCDTDSGGHRCLSLTVATCLVVGLFGLISAHLQCMRGVSDMKMFLCYACGCLCTTVSYLSASFGDPGLLSAWEAASGDLEAAPSCNLVRRGSHEVGEQQIECECGRPHPPRSRRCRHCKQCVLRYDHHCHALNQCVGLGNIGSFLAFCWSLFCCQCMTLYVLRADNPDAAAEFICLALTSDITGLKTSQQNQTTDTRFSMYCIRFVM